VSGVETIRQSGRGAWRLLRIRDDTSSRAVCNEAEASLSSGLNEVKEARWPSAAGGQERGRFTSCSLLLDHDSPPDNLSSSPCFIAQRPMSTDAALLAEIAQLDSEFLVLPFRNRRCRS
jgi:hypothetical protein